jgi:hypothetical protein
MTVNFQGSAKRLAPEDIREAAEVIGVSEAHVRAVIEVETSGKGFDAHGRPIFLFEPHRFWKELGPGHERNKAVAQGLAYPNWRGPGSYPKSAAARWEQFERACDISLVAAIRSASWGLGQIMGDNYEACGYDSPEAMVRAFAESEREQVIGMCRLLQSWGLDAVLKQFPSIAACRKFAKRYNGAAYERNNYHNKLQSSYLRWAKRLKTTEDIDDSDGVLRIGSRGVRVEALQKKLKDLGYHVKPDGQFGNLTRDAVLAWKADNDLPLTPEVSPEDFSKLETSNERPLPAERTEASVKDIKGESRIAMSADNVKKAGAAAVGLGAVTEGVKTTGVLEQAEQVGTVATKVRGLLDAMGITNLMNFIVSYRYPITIALVCVAFYFGHKVLKARLEDKQTGKTV